MLSVHLLPGLLKKNKHVHIFHRDRYADSLKRIKTLFMAN